MQKAADLQQAYYRWESNLKEFQRGRPTGLDDDVKANAMRHMMPKEILDAVKLQPRYRTFVEIRDYMLHQRADVFVRDVCPATKKVVTTPSRVNTSTNNSTATKNTTLVPMAVSQMSSDVLKSEAVGQESDSYQYEQDQDCHGDELCAVKGKGKGGFKGTCFKCGMRGHKADRCCQKGKGKGGKGDWEKGKGGYKGKSGSKGKGWSKGEWSNPGHTWDNSWYHSHWHGEAHGLEVDPWAAFLEPVHHLCAASLKPSCEEFSEPKHVRKGHCTNTLQLESSGTFAHVNRFSTLASDDDEKSLGGCGIVKQVHQTKSRTWKIGGERDDGFSCCHERRRIGGERDDGFSFCDERVDGCMDPEITMTFRRIFDAFQSGWKGVSAIMDSRSAECVAPETIARNISLMETAASRQGQTYHTADGGVIKNKGEKTVTMYSEDGDQFRAVPDHRCDPTTQLNQSCV